MAELKYRKIKTESIKINGIRVDTDTLRKYLDSKLTLISNLVVQISL